MNYRTIGPLAELCNFKTNMHESSCQSKKQVMAIMNWSSGEHCGPWASCFSLTECEDFAPYIFSAKKMVVFFCV